MASRTLNLLFTLSIIFTNIETKTLNETSNYKKNQAYCRNETFVNQHFNKTDGIINIYGQQRVYANPESKHGIEIRNRYVIEQMLNKESDADKIKTPPSNNGLKSNTTLSPIELTPTIKLDNSNHFSNKKKFIQEDDQINLIHNDLLETLALKTAIKKVQQELSETKYKMIEESLHNAATEDLTHTKPGQGFKNTNTRQSMTENLLTAEDVNGIHKTKHREKINHKSPGKRVNDIYELQRPNELKKASKHDNKLKYIDNKNRDALSLENEQYELNHLNDIAEELVSEEINLDYTPKYKQKKNHQTDKPIYRLKQLTTRNRNTNTRTTQSVTENSLMVEVDNSLHKTKLREKIKHKSSGQRENGIHELKRRNEFKIISKHDNKLKYIDNNSDDDDALSLENEQYELNHVSDMAEVWVSKQNNLKYKPKYKRNFQKRKHHDDILTKDKHTDKTKQNSKIKHDYETYRGKYKLAVKRKDEDESILDSGDTLNADDLGTETLEQYVRNRNRPKRGNKGGKLKHRHNKKTHRMSLENEIYTLKNQLNDIQRDKMKVPKQVVKLNKPNHQKNTHDKIANKNKYNGKPKNKTEKVISNINKQNHKLYFITTTNTNILRKDERIFDSKDKLKVDEEDIRTESKLVGRQGVRQSDEEVTIESYEEPLKQNTSFSLPFYISTTTLGTKDKDLKHTKKKRETETLLDDLNTVLNEKINRNNDNVLNQTINRLVSSKLFDFLTDRVAGKMLKKLQTMEGSNLLSEHQFKAKTEMIPDEVEQIGILFEKNGEMQVVMSRENITETRKNNSGGSGDIEAFSVE